MKRAFRIICKAAATHVRRFAMLRRPSSSYTLRLYTIRHQQPEVILHDDSSFEYRMYIMLLAADALMHCNNFENLHDESDNHTTLGEQRVMKCAGTIIMQHITIVVSDQNVGITSHHAGTR